MLRKQTFSDRARFSLYLNKIRLRYFLELSYSGKAYNGWQIQPNAPSVQAVLQEGLSTLLRTPTEVVGAGRTDTGVHAAFYVAHFDAVQPVTEHEDFLYHLNAVLPGDIAVSALRPVRDDAHARFDARLREYKYYVSTRKNPFVRDTACQLFHLLDTEAMNRAAALLSGYDDFTSFAKLHAGNKTNICRVSYAAWSEQEGLLVFTIAADRFLRNMVRAIVGTLFEVGRGKLDTEGFRRVIEGADRALGGTSAPPQGLFLTRVEYPDELYLDT